MIITLLNNPKYMPVILENIDHKIFTDSVSKKIFQYMQNLFANQKQITIAAILDKINDEKIKQFITKESMSDKYSSALTDVRKQLNDCLFKIKLYWLDTFIKKYNRQIKDINDFTGIKEIEQKIQKLIIQKQDLKKNKKNLIV